MERERYGVPRRRCHADESISATVGTSVLVLTHAVPSNDFWSTWAVWWTGDAMGVLLVAPFLLSFLPSSAGPRLTLPSAALLAGLSALTAALTIRPARAQAATCRA